MVEPIWNGTYADAAWLAGNSRKGRLNAIEIIGKFIQKK